MERAELPPRLLARLVGQRGDITPRIRTEDAYDPTAPVPARVRAARWLLQAGRTDSKLVALKILARHREEPLFDDIYQEPLAGLLDELVEGWMKQVPYDDYIDCVRSYAKALLGSDPKVEPVVERMSGLYGDPDLPSGKVDDFLVAHGADPEKLEMTDVTFARDAAIRGMYALLPHAVVDQLDDLEKAVDRWLRNAGFGHLVYVIEKNRQPARRYTLHEALGLCDFIRTPNTDLWKIIHGKPGYRLIARCFPDAPKLFEQWLKLGMSPTPLTANAVRNALDGVTRELEDIARWSTSMNAPA